MPFFISTGTNSNKGVSVNDTELERSLIRHAKEAIKQSESDALKQFGSAVIVPAEIAKKSNMDGEHISAFLKEIDIINTHEDSLLLVCLGMIYTAATSNEKSDLLLPELSEGTLGFVMSQYYPLKKLVNAERAAELFPNEPSNPATSNDTSPELMQDFEWLVSVTIGRLYKKSPLWKQRLMWQLVKEWNSNKFNVGVPKLVKDKFGDAEALELFRTTANTIMNDPELLDKAVNDYKESNPYAS